MSKFTKHTGGKEQSLYEELDAFLNEEADTILAGAKKLEKKQISDIGQMKIRLINEEIIPLVGTDGEQMLCLGIASLDSKLYGYILRPKVNSVHIEELYMNKTRTNILGSFLIEDFMEWSTLSNYFQRQNLLEYHRIINWVISQSFNNPASLNEMISKLAWLEKVNKKLEAKYKDPLTINEIKTKSLRNIRVPSIGSTTTGRTKPKRHS